LATDCPNDTANRFRIRVDGQMEWGTGTASPDIILYRLAAGVLTTPETFYAGQNVMVGGLLQLYQNATLLNKAGNDWVAILTRNSAGTEVVGDLQNIGTITWGGDTNLYRLAANYLATADSLYVAQSFQLGGLAMLHSNINIMNKALTDSLPILVRDTSGSEAVGILSNFIYATFTEISAGSVANGSIYVDSGTHVINFKDSSGSSHALY
jgi:hypothetical protein